MPSSVNIINMGLPEQDSCWKKNLRQVHTISSTEGQGHEANMKILFVLVLACIVTQSVVHSFQLNVKRLLGSAAIASSLFSGAVVQADSREIGSIATSGLIFKDTLKINAFKDPKVDGVIIYLSDFERPLTGEQNLSSR